MNRIDSAVHLFNKGCNCSQAILSTYCEIFGMNPKMACQVATGFGGGMRRGETCGALTGAIMVLGLKYGNSDAEDLVAKQNAYAKVVEFTKEFTARNGSAQCKELLGFDLSYPEGF